MITAAVLLVVAGVIFATGQAILSPGPLSAVAAENTPLGGVSSHAQLSRQCGACHSAPWSSETMAQRCLACHTSVAADLQTGGTLHGMLLPPGSTLTCKEGCHVEHRGATANLTALGSAHLPSNNLGFSLKAHQTKLDGQLFGCLDCHQSGVGSFDQRVCYNCHRDIDSAFAQSHLNAFGLGCLQCHDGIDTYGKAFDHNAVSFKLAGKHASVACGGCHANARTIAQLKSAPQTCYACHQKDDKHAGSYGQNCAQCHNTLDWAQVTVDHNKTDFPLTGKHITVDCAACHVNKVFKGTPVTCYGCHQKDDKHGGVYGQNCAQCHNTSDWAQVTVDHSKTAYPLTGKHSTVACAACHVNKVFKGTSNTCNACHQKDDKHAGSYGQNCTQCHNTSDWAQVTLDHSKTAYPLTGKHLTVPCASCHVNKVFKGTFTTCYVCHQSKDPHQGALGQNCAECHNTNGWKAATYNRPHRFPINHEAPRGTTTSCSTCHPTSLLTYTCYGCHAHTTANILRQHRNTQNLDDCVRCHQAGRSRGSD